MPSDRPVVVFRFAPGEAADPIDVRSLAVLVDGRDRSKLFQATSTEAWGSLVARDAAASTGIESGAHHVVARICSIRGACSEVATVIQVVASTVPDESIPPRRRALLDLLVEAARKLLKP